MSEPSNRWRLVLVVSLALNLFVLGAVSTAWLASRGWLPFRQRAERPPRIVGMPNPRQLRATLPAPDHGALDAALAAHGPEIRRRVRDLAAARAEVADAIRAEP